MSPQVHITDVTSLFLIIFAHALITLKSDSEPPTRLTAYQKYFIASTGATNWNVLSKLVSNGLAKAKSERVEALPTLEVRSVSADGEELGFFGP
jgi:hypothetical protein